MRRTAGNVAIAGTGIIPARHDAQGVGKEDERNKAFSFGVASGLGTHDIWLAGHSDARIFFETSTLDRVPVARLLVGK
jgi:hypothetical protein